jgi:hypothetical protein
MLWRLRLVLQVRHHLVAEVACPAGHLISAAAAGATIAA